MYKNGFFFFKQKNIVRNIYLNFKKKIITKNNKKIIPALRYFKIILSKV